MKKLNYLFISKSADLRNLLNFFLEGNFQCHLDHFSTAKDALSYLNGTTQYPHIIAYDFDPSEEMLDELLSCLRTLKGNVHIIIMNNNIDHHNLSFLQRHSCYHLIDQTLLLNELLVTTVNKYGEDFLTKDRHFSRISFECLELLDGISRDLYIKLSEEKYVKIFNEDDEPNSADIEKYKTKGVKYLYINQETTEWTIEQIKSQFPLLISHQHFKFQLVSPDEDPKTIIEKKIFRIQEQLHLEDEFRDKIDNTVTKVLRILEANPKVGAILKKIKDKNLTFFSQKARLLSFVCSFISKEMEWNSKSTIEKLIYASFLHDITIASRPDLMKFKDLAELRASKQNFSAEDMTLYNNHPEEAVNLLKNSFNAITHDAAPLILQHHELPAGSGFPHQLPWGKIPPLSALFIVSNDLTYYLLRESKPEIQEYLLYAESRFDVSNFRKILQKIKKIKLK